MKLNKIPIRGCHEILPNIYEDKRGKFIKTFHFDSFKEFGLSTECIQEYHSVSKRKVLRGLHFQVSPYENIKTVACIKGRIFDAVVDVRINSGTYGKCFSAELDDNSMNQLYIPPGLAHGFCVLSDLAIVWYRSTKTHHPDSEVTQALNGMVLG